MPILPPSATSTAEPGTSAGEPGAAGADGAAEGGHLLTTDELVTRLSDLPSHPTVALQVMWVADDPNTGASDLARALSGDPTLTAKVLRMANSAYYGFPSRVGSVQLAVQILGFETVRSLATVAATGLDSEETVPDWFWAHAGATAVAAEMLASRFKVRSGDAFSLGLLHDLGIALLITAGGADYEEVTGELLPSEITSAERQHWGMTHPEIAEAVLAAWNFPSDMVSAIATHHRTDPTSNLNRLLAAAEQLACIARPVPAHRPGSVEELAVALEVAPADVETMANRVEEDHQALTSAMASKD